MGSTPSCDCCARLCVLTREDVRPREVHGQMYNICPSCEKRGCPELAPSVVVAPDFGVEQNFKRAGTSSDAAASAAKTAKLNKTHFKILGALACKPMSPDQVVPFFLAEMKEQLNWSTARARMTDLRNAGLITETGEKTEAMGGKEANVMRLTTAAERAEHEQQKQGAAA